MELTNVTSRMTMLHVVLQPLSSSDIRCGCKRLQWAAYIPDLNLVEHKWNPLERLWTWEECSISTAQLATFLQQVWIAISIVVYQIIIKYAQKGCYCNRWEPRLFWSMYSSLYTIPNCCAFHCCRVVYVPNEKCSRRITKFGRSFPRRC